MAKYAEVIVPVPVGTTFTYIIPESMRDIIRPMMRVVVPFGLRKHHTAVVVGLSDTFEGDYKLKEITWLPDTEPILRRPQLELWRWICEYYMCSPGEVFKAALPSGLKIETETTVTVNPDFIDGATITFTPNQQSVWESILSHKYRSIRDLERDGFKNVVRTVYELMDLGAVCINEKLTERFRPKKEQYYSVTIPRGDSVALRLTFDNMKRSPRRQGLLMHLLQLSEFTNLRSELKPVSREAIAGLPEYDRTSLRDFARKGFISIEDRTVSRFKWTERPLKQLPVLSDAQSKVLDEIHKSFVDHQVTLLHGVTSSGKTEIYIHLIDYILNNRVSGNQALMLVPEIALTTQLTRRLQDVFGQKVVIYHSRFSDAERVEIWNRLLHTTEPLVVIGARSAVFLPFNRLGLVIVDEEHEPSYKQFDPAPRYNGRDVATVLARLHGAKTLLASATPTIETYNKSIEGKYGLATLSERYSGAQLPRTEIIDLSQARRTGELTDSLANSTVRLTNEALARGEQAIFFHNRRGYAPIARCKECEYIPKCADCDVSLSYHRRIDRLVCHYCGKEYALPVTCPVCKQPAIEIVGYGTERVEDNISEIFPSAKILRMDFDTTRNKDDYSTIIDAFSQHKADILVGTQMVTKGLDFGDVSTVVVLSADHIINYPDFRAAERAFNMLEQVAGRAGRRTAEGKVLIQTFNPEHPIIKFAIDHDYNGFYEYELTERKSFGYPPFARIIYIYVRHRDSATCALAASELTTRLTAQLGNRILGPHEPAVNRVKAMYIRRIMVKIEPTVSITQIKNILRDTVHDVRSLPQYRSADFYFDVDPQ